jgi:hypothetical protein
MVDVDRFFFRGNLVQRAFQSGRLADVDGHIADDNAIMLPGIPEVLDDANGVGEEDYCVPVD